MKYFKAFIKFGKTYLINETYKNCIYLIKTDIKKNLNFIDIINSSIRKLIEKDPDYFNRFISDMLILLNPTKDGKIDSNCHVHSDCEIIRCCQLLIISKTFCLSFFFVFLFLLL